MTAIEFSALIEAHFGGLSGEEGLQYGDPGMPVTGLAAAWFPTVAAARTAAEAGASLLLVHEELFCPYEFLHRPENWQDWGVNRARRAALEECEVGCYRLHYTADVHGILDDFRGTLGFPEPEIREGLQQLCRLPERRFAEWIPELKQRLGLGHVRVAGPLDKPVSLLGLAWGGLGISLNAGFLNQMVALGAEGIIAGEVDEYALRMLEDLSVPVFEAGHCISEEAGFRRFATELAACLFPALPFTFIDQGRGYEVV